MATLRIVHNDLQDLDEKVEKFKSQICKLNKVRDKNDDDIKRLLTRVSSLEERLTKAEKEIKEQDSSWVTSIPIVWKTDLRLSSIRSPGRDHS